MFGRRSCSCSCCLHAENHENLFDPEPPLDSGCRPYKSNTLTQHNEVVRYEGNCMQIVFVPNQFLLLLLPVAYRAFVGRCWTWSWSRATLLAFRGPFTRGRQNASSRFADAQSRGPVRDLVSLLVVR